jgi:hypothetical protein
MNPYRELAYSIVLRAVEDYRMALRGKEVEEGKSTAYTLRECVTFFRSDWFKCLANLDGEFIVKKLKDELKEELNASNTCTSNT